MFPPLKFCSLSPKKRPTNRNITTLLFYEVMLTRLYYLFLEHAPLMPNKMFALWIYTYFRVNCIMLLSPLASSSLLASSPVLGSRYPGQ